MYFLEPRVPNVKEKIKTQITIKGHFNELFVDVFYPPYLKVPKCFRRILLTLLVKFTIFP